MQHLTNRAAGLVAAMLGLLLVPIGSSAAEVPATPFFAMDTAIRSLDKLDLVKGLGYAGVGWKVLPPDALAVALKQIQQQDLRLFAVYGSATLTKTELKWSADLEADLAVLEKTDAIIWLPIYSKDFPASADAGDAVAVPALQRLADLAAKHGVRIAIYPHKGAWAERVQDAVRIAKKVNRENLGATFNLCHCLAAGDEVKIPQLLEEAMPKLFLVTINGADTNAAGAAWTRLIQPLGQGTYDVKSLLKKLHALGYKGPIGLQGYGIKLAPEENLKQSMAAWKELTAQ